MTSGIQGRMARIAIAALLFTVGCMAEVDTTSDLEPNASDSQVSDLAESVDTTATTFGELATSDQWDKDKKDCDKDDKDRCHQCHCDCDKDDHGKDKKHCDKDDKDHCHQCHCHCDKDDGGKDDDKKDP